MATPGAIVTPILLTGKDMLTYTPGMAPDPRPEVFAAIAHPVRRRILDLLAEEERPVNAIASNFQVSRPAISQHLRVLLDAGLVSEYRHGRERRYRLVPEELAEIYGWLAHYQRFWTDQFQSLTQQLAVEPSGEPARRPAIDGSTAPPNRTDTKESPP
jgi:DNA-binding transcriptional ArsR family regulator